MVERLRQGLRMLLKPSRNFFETNESGGELTTLSRKTGSFRDFSQGDCAAGKQEKEAKRVTPLAYHICKSFPLGSKTVRQRRVAAQGTPRVLSYRTDLVGQSTDTENSAFSMSKLRCTCTALHRDSHWYLLTLMPQPLYSSPRSPH